MRMGAAILGLLLPQVQDKDALVKATLELGSQLAKLPGAAKAEPLRQYGQAQRPARGVRVVGAGGEDADILTALAANSAAPNVDALSVTLCSMSTRFGMIGGGNPGANGKGGDTNLWACREGSYGLAGSAGGSYSKPKEAKGALAGAELTELLKKIEKEKDPERKKAWPQPWIEKWRPKDPGAIVVCSSGGGALAVIGSNGTASHPDGVEIEVVSVPSKCRLVIVAGGSPATGGKAGDAKGPDGAMLFPGRDSPNK
jgi:hypothetical protein